MAAQTMTPSELPQRPKQQAPQETIDEFWAKFTSKKPGKATTIIPQNQYAQRAARRNLQQCPSTATQASYDDAAAMCRAKVEKIAKECRRINKRYRDPHFDIEFDLKWGARDCLQSLDNDNAQDHVVPGADFAPRSVKRVVDIFDKPRFFIDGPAANDVRQGKDGDCWLMAALCTLSNKKGLIEKLCAHHDEEVGVYGFVFFRDGEWISEIVDDYLYLTKADYSESNLDRILFNELERANPAEAYRRIYQSNSSSLYFAQCQHQQETWLPLLEKCYAKAHGDYAAISGGFGGEGIEDLTGGVTSELFSSDILDKEYFWKENLLKVNEDFLFGCSTGVFGLTPGVDKGILDRHAYSIQHAVEMDGHRLLRLKNPWGNFEWKGAWSDGSEEWTAEWLKKLNHRFGDDGEFWISYEDFLKKFQAFDRTRLFGPDWKVAQIWTTLVIPWTIEYHKTYFAFSLLRSGPVVVVLSQLDDRYFRGLEGQYSFELAFRIHKAGHEEYVVRSQTPYRMRRSVNVELDLEKGDYEVRIKISATRREYFKPVDQVIRENAKKRRDKLSRVGLAYDMAHSKGQFVESLEERASREARRQKDLEKKKRTTRNKILFEREEAHYLKTKNLLRERRNEAKKKRGKHPKKKVQIGQEENGIENSKRSKITNEDGGPKDEAHADKLQATEPSELKSNGRDEDEPGPHQNGSSHANGHTHISDWEVESLDALSDLSDRELDLQVEAHLKRNKGPTQEQPPHAPAPTQEQPDEFEKDPWNAAVVVGLRVYHKIPEDDEGENLAKLQVVRPNLLGRDSEDEEDEDGEKATGLDVDDSSKDATLEGGVKERKRSILGDSWRFRQWSS